MPSSAPGHTGSAPAGGGRAVPPEAQPSSAALSLRSPQVNYWHSDQCNMINGTAGQMWAPFMTPESSLEFYSPEACR